MGSITPIKAPSPLEWANPFRTRILNHQITPVMAAKYFLGPEIAMMAAHSGLHALFIDMEHSTLTTREVSSLTLSCHSVGISPLVRVPSKSHWHISRALDAGAHAVIIPHCDTVEEVKAIVNAGKYAPLGSRGSMGNQPVLDFKGGASTGANALLNRETMIIPMVETPAAVELVDEFLAIDGVDGILIGSNDLCADLGIPGQYDERVYQDAVSRVVRAGVKAGKPVGIGGIGPRPDLLEMWFRMGASWALSGADGSMVMAGMKKMGESYEAMQERVLLGTKR